MLQHPAEQHYPTYQEIHQALFHTETSIYAGFQPLPSMWYGGGVTQDTIAFLRSQLQRPVKFMVEVGNAYFVRRLPTCSAVSDMSA